MTTEQFHLASPEGKIIKLPKRDPMTCPLPEAYYYDASGGKDYFFRINDKSERFIRIGIDSLRRQLKGMDYSSICDEGEKLSELDVLLNRIQLEHRVAYAGPLAGHKVGMYESDNEQVLVTDPPIIIEPKEGEWSTLYTFISHLLGGEQEDYFFGWLKVAYETVRRGANRPGQALFLAGPPRSGKSLLQKLISTVLGGQARTANPYQYMIGRTDFNSDLFRAEHLIIDDTLQ